MAILRPDLHDSESLHWTVRSASGATLLVLVGGSKVLKVGIVEAVMLGVSDDYIAVQCLASTAVMFPQLCEGVIKPFPDSLSVYNGIRATRPETKPSTSYTCQEMPRSFRECVQVRLNLSTAGFELESLQPPALRKTLQQQNCSTAQSVAALLALDRQSRYSITCLSKGGLCDYCLQKHYGLCRLQRGMVQSSSLEESDVDFGGDDVADMSGLAADNVELADSAAPTNTECAASAFATQAALTAAGAAIQADLAASAMPLQAEMLPAARAAPPATASMPSGHEAPAAAAMPEADLAPSAIATDSTGIAVDWLNARIS